MVVDAAQMNLIQDVYDVIVCGQQAALLTQ